MSLIFARIWLGILLLVVLPARAALIPESDVWEMWVPHDADNAIAVDHSAWQLLLDRHLSRRDAGINLFDYASVTAEGRESLRAYLDELAAADPRSWRQAEPERVAGLADDSGSIRYDYDWALTPFSALTPGSDTGAWKPMQLRGRRPASYEIVDGGSAPTLRVSADSAASALVHRLEPAVTAPVQLAWRWRIDSHINASDIMTKAGDDFPARVYVTFGRDVRELPFSTRAKMRLAKLLYGQDVPAAALCYVWARDVPEGTIVPNAYSDTVMMVVARSGGETPSDWQQERRNLQADYRAAFGTDAPPVTSVIVAADTDDTGESVLTWFGDFELVPAE